MAQLGARLNGIEEVVGSNPTGSTLNHFEQLQFAVPEPVPETHSLNPTEFILLRDKKTLRVLESRMIIAIARNGDYSRVQRERPRSDEPVSQHAVSM